MDGNGKCETWFTNCANAVYAYDYANFLEEFDGNRTYILFDQ